MSNSDEFCTGTIGVDFLTKKARFIRGFKKSLKIVGIAGGIALIFAFMEPFLFLIWGSIFFLVLLFGVGPYLHASIYNEAWVIREITGKCPYCKESRFERVGARLKNPLSIICQACGRKITVELEDSYEEKLK